MSKVMFSFPNELITRMKMVIPAGERSQVLAKLVEQEIDAREQKLYEAALKLESNNALQKEMQGWDNEFFNDGLEHV